jgi:hypothetical protein
MLLNDTVVFKNKVHVNKNECFSMQDFVLTERTGAIFILFFKAIPVSVHCSELSICQSTTMCIQRVW